MYSEDTKLRKNHTNGNSEGQESLVRQENKITKQRKEMISISV
jgi:hypothetical protein